MKTYGSKNVVCIVNGIALTGLAPGDDVFLFKFAEDRIQKNVGIDGAVALAVNNNDTGEATIKLMQTSPSNLYLMGLTALQKGITALVPISMIFQDTFRLDRVVGINGWIETTPDITRGSNINTQEWKLGFETMTFVFGAL